LANDPWRASTGGGQQGSGLHAASSASRQPSRPSRTAMGGIRTVSILDFSAGGLQLQGAFGVATGDLVGLDPLSGHRLRAKVAWSLGSRIGARFSPPLARGTPALTVLERPAPFFPHWSRPQRPAARAVRGEPSPGQRRPILAGIGPKLGSARQRSAQACCPGDAFRTMLSGAPAKAQGGPKRRRPKRRGPKREGARARTGVRVCELPSPEGDSF
jgi:hypothetical protein